MSVVDEVPSPWLPGLKGAARASDEVVHASTPSVDSGLNGLTGWESLLTHKTADFVGVLRVVGVEAFG